MMENVVQEINKLKKEKKAIILAHYYQRPEIQEIADVVGDSYYLSKIARDCKEQLIIFCGVKFMAESAKILSPEKTILLPVLDAGCPMADMADEEGISKWKLDHPNAAVVAYINSSTEVKALCDVCVTSSSAEKIINNIDSDEILFLPDENLGGYLSEKFPSKKFILWKGFCITHKKVNPKSIVAIKEQIPDIKVLVHPECEHEVRSLGDYVGSTSGIINFATENDFKNYLIVTEEGILHELKMKNPDKNFYVPGKTMTCVNMKKTTLEDVYESLVNNTFEIKLDEDLRLNALHSLMRMHELSS
ncbi:quinolinate synthase NadA [Alkalibaculum sp. M08DMB]|uniref:Quinolinate synthase n=1 Tax=Alkalibaculum sporogenes TaxID=2655001 RepID=A0A6A7K6L4_9FIRM|nr:quinolinate synthase NadA [Alkalibaculum sporogenes]MPW25088.1 quinolinate synthase NadA [Alkalibaculum sporogenes]